MPLHLAKQIGGSSLSWQRTKSAVGRKRQNSPAFPPNDLLVHVCDSAARTRATMERVVFDKFKTGSCSFNAAGTNGRSGRSKCICSKLPRVNRYRDEP